jgi:hypothetical protein
VQPPVQALHERLDRLNDAARTALREARPLIHVHDVGIVQSTGQGIARVSGLPGIRAEELIQFAGGVSGMVLDIEPNDVGVVLFGAQEQLSSGAEARRCRLVLDVLVGPELLGRVVNPLGTPLEMSTIPTTVPNNPRSGARVVSSPIASTPWSSSRASSRPTCSMCLSSRSGGRSATATVRSISRATCDRLVRVTGSTRAKSCAPMRVPTSENTRSPARRERWSCTHFAAVMDEPTTEHTKIGNSVRTIAHASIVFGNCIMTCVALCLRNGKLRTLADAAMHWSTNGSSPSRVPWRVAEIPPAAN